MTRAVHILAVLLLVAFVQCAGACSVAACDTAQKSADPPCHPKKAEVKPGCEHKLAPVEAQVKLSPESMELPAEAPAVTVSVAAFDCVTPALRWRGDPPDRLLPLRI